MGILDRKSRTKTVVVWCAVVSVLTSLFFPSLPAIFVKPFLVLFGAGHYGFRGVLVARTYNSAPFEVMAAYVVPGVIGTLSVWYASRLDFERKSDDHFGRVIPWALAYFAIALVVGFVTSTEGTSFPPPFWALFILVPIGIPVLLTLPAVAVTAIFAGLVVAPQAYSYLSARYEAEKTFAGATGTDAGGAMPRQTG